MPYHRVPLLLMPRGRGPRHAGAPRCIFQSADVPRLLPEHVWRRDKSRGCATRRRRFNAARIEIFTINAALGEDERLYYF
jgi:hypothetical protein